jgi:hypothetical protein
MESQLPSLGLSSGIAPLIPPILYIIAAVIALMVVLRIQAEHRRVLTARLKLDLFEKRYEFLQMLRNITSITLGSDGRYFDKVQKDYAKFAHFKLLFPLSIARQVDRLIATCDEYFISSESMRSMPDEPDVAERKEVKRLREKIRDEMEALQEDIEDIIRVDWNG